MRDLLRAVYLYVVLQFRAYIWKVESSDLKKSQAKMLRDIERQREKLTASRVWLEDWLKDPSNDDAKQREKNEGLVQEIDKLLPKLQYVHQQISQWGVTLESM
jgi:hypothetical protein